MNAQEFVEWAREVMRRHGVTAQLRFSRAVRVLGRWNERSRTITITRHLLDRPELDGVLKDTLLHEVAHAIAGACEGHGEVWRRACLRVGAQPKRCAEAGLSRLIGATKWVVACVDCDNKIERIRKPRPALTERYRCKKCNGRLTVKHKNHDEVTK